MYMQEGSWVRWATGVRSRHQKAGPRQCWEGQGQGRPAPVVSMVRTVRCTSNRVWARHAFGADLCLCRVSVHDGSASHALKHGWDPRRGLGGAAFSSLPLEGHADGPPLVPPSLKLKRDVAQPYLELSRCGTVESMGRVLRGSTPFETLNTCREGMDTDLPYLWLSSCREGGHGH